MCGQIWIFAVIDPILPLNLTFTVTLLGDSSEKCLDMYKNYHNDMRELEKDQNHL